MPFPSLHPLTTYASCWSLYPARDLAGPATAPLVPLARMAALYARHAAACTARYVCTLAADRVLVTTCVVLVMLALRAMTRVP